MPASREKAYIEPSDTVTARLKRLNTRAAPTIDESNRSNGHGAEVKPPKQRASRSSAETEATKSFPHGVSSRPHDRESSNNRYHCGFAQ